jgi:microcystin-dependent protein
MPHHNHVARASSAEGDQIVPAGNVLARTVNQIYHDATNLQATKSGTVASVGGSQAHDNMQPYLAVNFVIALQGLVPSRN